MGEVHPVDRPDERGCEEDGGPGGDALDLLVLLQAGLGESLCLVALTLSHQRGVDRQDVLEQRPEPVDPIDDPQYVVLHVAKEALQLRDILTVNATLVAQRQNEEIRELTEASIAQGEEVKKISAWAAILFAPTLVGTVYGMNFDVMPELSWTFGYPFALVLMLGVSVTLYAVFKRRDWI